MSFSELRISCHVFFHSAIIHRVTRFLHVYGQNFRGGGGRFINFVDATRNHSGSFFVAALDRKFSFSLNFKYNISISFQVQRACSSATENRPCRFSLSRAFPNLSLRTSGSNCLSDMCRGDISHDECSF